MLKKTQTEYYFTFEDESITIKVNEECDHLNYKPIWVEEAHCWRHPEQAVEYYEWVLASIKEMIKELKIANIDKKAIK